MTVKRENNIVFFKNIIFNELRQIIEILSITLRFSEILNIFCKMNHSTYTHHII